MQQLQLEQLQEEQQRERSLEDLRDISNITSERNEAVATGAVGQDSVKSYERRSSARRIADPDLERGWLKGSVDEIKRKLTELQFSNSCLIAHVERLQMKANIDRVEARAELRHVQERLDMIVENMK